MNRKQGKGLLIVAAIVVAIVVAVAFAWQEQAPMADSSDATVQTVRADEPATQASNDAGHVEQEKAASQDKTAPAKNAEAAPAEANKVQPAAQDSAVPSDTTAEQQGHETTTAGSPKSVNNEEAFVMPAGAEFVESEMLIRVDPTAKPEEIDAVLAKTPGIVSQPVSAEDVASGMVSVKLEEGTSVEDAVNAIRDTQSALVQGAQPNYVYHVAEEVAVEPVTTEGAEGGDAPASEASAGQDAVADEGVPAEEGPATETDEAAQTAEAVETVATASESDAEGTNPLTAQSPRLETASTTTNDPRLDELWNLKSTRTLDAWDLAKSEGNVAVAVLDDGFYVDHADLKANIIAGSPYDAMRNDNDVTPDYSTNHGTHVAGIVGAVANNGEGIAGASYNAKIVPIKVFDNEGNATTQSVSDAYQYVLQHREEWNIKVANLSLGVAVPNDNFVDDALLQAVKSAYDQGIVTVGAACNQRGSAHPPFYAYPSDYEYVVSVINLSGSAVANGNDASGSYDVTRNSTSNYNVNGQGGANTRKGKNISAPGSNVLSTVRTGYASDSGTSMASPLVSGVVALEFAANPGLSAGGAIDVLYTTAHDIGDAGWDRVFGHGEVDAYAAVMLASASSSATAEIPDVGTVTATLLLPDDGYVYDGTEKRPSVEVVLNKDTDTPTTLTGSDYSVTYQNNSSAGLAFVKVVGAGQYVDKFNLNLSFEIKRRSLGDEQISAMLLRESYPYTGSAATPEATVMFGSTALQKGTDYVVTYKDNVNAGKATVVITGAGNFCDTVTKTFSITPLSIADGAASVAAIADQLYTGKAITPVPGLTLDDVKLKAGVDFDLTYENNIDAGTATVIATGKGNYAGTVQTTFKIVRPQASYRAHVQRLGWQNPVSDGAMSGTTGRSLRMESIAIELPDLPCTGGITYRLHLRRSGWQDWKSDGDLAGTVGKSWRSEAIQIKLTGDLSKSYDVYYRAHCQRFGWLGWAKNGQSAGSVGCSRRLEAVEIVLVPKGAAAPGPTNDILRTHT